MASVYTFIPLPSLALASNDLAGKLSRKQDERASRDGLLWCGAERRREEVAKLTLPAPSGARTHLPSLTQLACWRGGGGGGGNSPASACLSLLTLS